MTTSPVTCHAGDSLEQAARLLWEYDIGSLPVIDDEGRLVGMLTDRDICLAAYARKTTLGEIPVSMAMAAEVFSCTEGDSIERLQTVMRTGRIRRVPVVDEDDIPVGIVSINDLIRHVASSSERAASQEFLDTLAVAGEPARSHVKDLGRSRS